ncbi:MAG TPA: hypothetical protein VKR06_06525, partial [Ktedonosporobacter sp.]|nr:hypothetical protein [Ktedonosporobacter sp.]
IGDLPLWFVKRGLLAYAIADLAGPLSEKGLVAYVQADFFGGEGGQSAIVWQQGQVVLAVDETGIGAINQALQYLGVKAGDRSGDEFMMVGLGRHRFTERWQ